MKAQKISLLLIVLLITNYSFSNEPFKKGYVKNVWSEIDAKVDSTLFIPTFNRNSYEWESNGVTGFDIEKYNLYFKICSKNFWNIIHKNIVDDKLQIFAPWNPQWIDEVDDGFFRFPIVSDDSLSNTDFISNIGFREKLIQLQLLGYEMMGVPEVITSIEYPGEDSIDYNGNTVYYPFPTLWYQEKDIIKYRIREENVLDKNGALKKRVIKGIAPIVYEKDYNGQIIGEKVLFWVKFEDLVPILKQYFLLVDYGTKPKIMSYYKYLSNRFFSSKILKEEGVYLKKL
jgi:hypothetical protein